MLRRKVGEKIILSQGGKVIAEIMPTAIIHETVNIGIEAPQSVTIKKATSDERKQKSV